MKKKRAESTIAQHLAFARALAPGKLSQLEAARKAGRKGADKTVQTWAERAYRKDYVIDEIRRIQEEAHSDAVASVLEVKEFLTAVMRASVTDFMTEDLTAFDLKGKDKKKLPVIDSIEFSSHEGYVTTSIKSITLGNKQQAAEKLCKIMGMFAPEKKEITGKDGGPIQTKTVDLSKLDAAELLRLASLSDEQINKLAPDADK